MNKKHFVAPIIQQWIDKLNDKSSSDFIKQNYAGYLEETKKAIDYALTVYNMSNKK
jgi:hypothetical protein